MRMLADKLVQDILTDERLPEDFGQTIRQHYAPIAEYLASHRHVANRTTFIGINGSQGSGKSTLALVLKRILEHVHGLKVAVISIDDLYLTKAEREMLARDVHPLLATRGVPGTHDIALGHKVFDSLSSAEPDDITHIPRFDKAADDRATIHTWSRFKGRADIILLEGWCVGVTPQETRELMTPINDLEQKHDPDGTWRNYINTRIASVYRAFFDRLDKRVLLKAPSFECVFEWRKEQERKLWARLDQTARAHSTGLMTDDQLHAFIMHYERLTRHMLHKGEADADIVIKLMADHHVETVLYNGPEYHDQH